MRELIMWAVPLAMCVIVGGFILAIWFDKPVQIKPIVKVNADEQHACSRCMPRRRV